MTKLVAFTLAVVPLLGAAAGCSKSDAKDSAHKPDKVAKDDMAKPDKADVDRGDPANLPAPGTPPPAVAVTTELSTIWQAPIKTLKGEPTTLDAFKGKALMLVNVASKCGNTPQYSALEALQKKYGPKGFTVIGFPCNQFHGQEPGTAEEIATFCSQTYGVTFPMMEKIEVNGANQHAIYKALEPIADAKGHTGDIRWNFEKFVVSADGTKVTRFDPKTQPDDPAVIGAVEAALPKT